MKLNETNYADWVILMEALLVRKGIWGVINGSEPRPAGSDSSRPVKAWQRKVDEARSEIILNVEVSQLPHVRGTDASEIWENLRNIHQARGLGTRLSRRRDFFRMSKKHDQVMSAWIADVRHAAFQLEEIGSDVKDDDIIFVLTNGLPPAYEQCIITLDSTLADELTLEYVISRLLNEESRQAPSTHSSNAALFSRTPHTRIRTPLEYITCFRCRQKGHYQSNCTQPLSAVPSATSATLSTEANLAF